MRQNPILPFYMTYPYPLFYEDKDQLMRDLEYIQEIYPSKAKEILGYVIAYLERIDYSGSVIYDEYPDRLGLENIINAIIEEIVNDASSSDTEDKNMSPEREQWTRNVVTLVLYHEILKRRQERKNGYLRF